MQLSALITGALLILTMPLAAQAVPPAQPPQPPRWVITDDLPVRNGPSPEYKVIGTLSRGAGVILKAMLLSRDFCRIEGEGQDGYVACQYLSVERVARPRAGENGVDSAQRWVSGNGVTLHEAPRPEATVVGRFALNAIVKLVREVPGTGYCEVQPATGPSGHTSCRYLAPTPVVLALIQGYRSADEALSSDYDPERAFWLEPSWNALVRYAEHLKHQHSNISLQGPWPRDEALERMKAHLALGIKGRKPDPYADWGKLKRKASQDMNEVFWPPLYDPISNKDGLARINRLVRTLEFPSVRPSLFRSESEVAPPSASTEEVSGRFSIDFRQLVSRRPKPKSGAEDGGGPGLYDMKTRTQELVRPVQRVRLFRDGRLHAESSFVSRKETLWYDVDEPECSDWSPGFGFGDADAGIWRYFDGDAAAYRQDSLKRNPAGSLFAFYTNSDLPHDKAIRTETLTELDRNDTGFVRGIHLHYDLDGDGVSDLAVWEGQGQGPGHLGYATTTDDRWYRLILVNINGAWKVLGSDAFGYGCGC